MKSSSKPSWVSFTQLSVGRNSKMLVSKIGYKMRSKRKSLYKSVGCSYK